VSTALIVASGKVTASPDQLASALRHHHVKTLKEKAPKAGASLRGPRHRGGTGQVQRADPRRSRHDRRLVGSVPPPGRSPAADECAILSSVPLEDHRARGKLTDLHLTRATTGRTSDRSSLTAAKMHDGPWLADWHTPAHNGGLDPKTWPTKVYESALEGLHVARREMRGPDGLVLAADWNVDLARGEIRDRLGHPYPHMTWSWHRGQAPTEGGRVIDGFLTNLPIRHKGETLPSRPGFDHHPVFAVLGEAASDK
jgi:hypothetical protein